MSVVALRYAHAFAGVVESQKLDTAAVQQQLGDFRGTFAGSKELREVLMDPAIPGDQKRRLLDAIAARIGMIAQARNFIAVIMDHRRLAELGQILDEYHQIADADAGYTEAEITSARTLAEGDRAQLEEQVGRLVGGKIRASYKEDPSLLGGAVVRVGSTVYDGSIRAQFQQLKQRLVSA